MNDLFMLPHLDIKWSMINQIELFRHIIFTTGHCTRDGLFYVILEFYKRMK